MTRSLPQQTGLRFALTRLETPKPNHAVLLEVLIHDGETDELIGRVRQIDTRRRGEEWQIRLSQPELQSGPLQSVWDVVHHRILRGHLVRNTPVTISASEVTLQAMHSTQTFVDVTCAARPATAGPKLKITFRIAGGEPTRPAELVAIRSRQSAPPRTQWCLDTRSAPLPCSLLADRFPLLFALGKQGTFQGSCRVTQARRGWSGDVRGRFNRVDLDQLVAFPFLGKLSGLAEISLTCCNFSDGQLVDAEGYVTSPNGFISRTLLESAMESLPVRPGNVWSLQETDAKLIRYRDLSLKFSINADALKLVGSPDGSVSTLLLADSRGAPLLTAKQESVPVVALAKLLSPHSELRVAATEERQLILRALPVPAIATRDQPDQGPYSAPRLGVDGP